MIIKDNIVPFVDGLACTKSLAFSQTEDKTSGQELPASVNKDELHSFIVGLILTGALNVPYNPPPPPVSSWDIDYFYKIFTISYQASYAIDMNNFYTTIYKIYPESFIIDLYDFYTTIYKIYPESFIIDMSDFYTVHIEYPEEE